MGYRSGYNNAGSGNLFLGASSGENETGSNKLYIENSNSATPLIYGDFSTDSLAINGSISGNSSVHFSGLPATATKDSILYWSNDSVYKGPKPTGGAGDTTFFTYSDPTLTAKPDITNFQNSKDTIHGTHTLSWGQQNASYSNNTLLHGVNNIADTDAIYSTTQGLRAKSTLFGEVSQASGHFANPGDAQTSVVTMRELGVHTSTSTYYLTLDASYTTDNKVNLVPNSAYSFEIVLQGITQNAAQVWRYTITGIIKRDNANNTTLVWSNVAEDYEDDADFVATVIADDTYESLVVGIQDAGGVSSNYTVRWNARCELTRTVFP